MYLLLLPALVLLLGIVFLLRREFRRAIVAVVAAVILVALIGPGPVPPKPAAKRNACIYFLNRLSEAKKQWAVVNNATNGAQPSLADLETIDTKLRVMPVCPDAGSYSINPVGQRPACSRADLGHVLP